MKASDPENYRNMSVPFETPSHANEALSNFMQELFELRKKHRLCDVTVVVSSNVLYADGDEGRTLAHSHLGDTVYQEGMLAYALGKVQAEHREKINKFLSGKMTRDIPADKLNVQQKDLL